MKCLAIDDEPLALRLLEDNISKVPYLELVGSCRNAFDAMNLIAQHTVDLVFTRYTNAGVNRPAVDWQS